MDAQGGADSARGPLVSWGAELPVPLGLFPQVVNDWGLSRVHPVLRREVPAQAIENRSSSVIAPGFSIDFSPPRTLALEWPVP